MSQIHFCSFGDSLRYSNSIRRIHNEASSSNWFHSVNVFTEQTLDQAFLNSHSNFMRYTRGFGYWIWKAQVTKQMLDNPNVNEGDIIVYIDSGCHINLQGKERFEHYVKTLQDSEHCVLGFQLPYIEKQWTKMDTLALFPDYIKDTNQLVGGLFMIKKNKQAIDLVQEWQSIMSNTKFIDDSPSTLANDPIFKEHRHDQSVWSCLRKLRGCVLFEDETYHENWDSEWIMSKPFHAKRIRC